MNFPVFLRFLKKMETIKKDEAREKPHLYVLY